MTSLSSSDKSEMTDALFVIPETRLAGNNMGG